MADETYNPLPRLIDFASKLRFEDLPANVVHETVRRAVDSLATALGGLSDPRLVERWRYMSQRPIAYEAGGWAYGAPRKLSLCDAAFLNSTMTRWLDYNDTYLAKEPAHPSDNLGFLFAMSGMQPVSGRDFITAAVIAYDVQCRLTEAASLRSHGWDHVNYILLSASLAGARLLGFDAEQMYNAVAFALSSNGAMRQAREGSYLSEQKNMAAADAVRGAAWALEKVLSGSDGPAEIIEGKHGLVNQMSGPLDAAAFDDLGSHFLLADTYIKPFPVEYHGQTVAEHALAIREKLGAPKLSDVAEVVITGYEAQRTIIGDEPKRRPADQGDGRPQPLLRLRRDAARGHAVAAPVPRRAAARPRDPGADRAHAVRRAAGVHAGLLRPAGPARVPELGARDVERRSHRRRHAPRTAGPPEEPDVGRADGGEVPPVRGRSRRRRRPAARRAVAPRHAGRREQRHAAHEAEDWGMNLSPGPSPCEERGTR